MIEGNTNKKPNDCNSSQQKTAKNQQGKIDDLSNKLSRLELELKLQREQLGKSKELNKMNRFNLDDNKKELKKSKAEEKKRQKGDSKS